MKPSYERALNLKSIGWTNREIARKLRIHLRTVERWFWEMREELDARSTPHLIRIAIEKKIIVL